MTFRKTPPPPPKGQKLFSMPKAGEPINLFGKGPSKRAVRDLCHGLQRLLAAGTPIHEAIDMLAKGARGPMASTLTSIADELKKGGTLVEAVSKVPTLFDAAETQLLAAAEKRGAIAGAFGAIGAGIETRLAVRKQLIDSSLYPSFVLLASFFLAPLPELVVGSTAVYLGLVMGKLSIFLGFVLGLGILVPLLLRKTELGNHGRRLMWAIPWPGSVYCNHVRGRFAGTLAANFNAGLMMDDAITIAAAVTVDPITIDRASESIKAIGDGAGFADGLGRSGIFTNKDSMPLVVGEQSGELVDTLKDIAKEYDERRDHGMKVLMKIFSTVITFIAFAVAAAGIMDTFSKGTAEIYDMVEQEMPYDSR